MRVWIAALLAACALVACAPMPTAPAAPAPAVPAGFPADDYAKAAARGEPVFRLDPTQSVVVMRVYRGGALARFGHDHVVASRDVHGYLLLANNSAERRADLYAPLASLSVDEPALRARAGFDTQPSQQDIDGTRRNMLEKVLEAGRFPFVSLHVDRAMGDPPVLRVNAAATLHGKTHAQSIALQLDTASANTVYVRGRFSVKQTDFGITPYSLLGGALRVEDRVDIEFDLAATRVVPGAIGN